MKDDVVSMMKHRRLVVSDARNLEQNLDASAELFFRYLLSLQPDVGMLFDHDKGRMKSAFRAMLRVFSSLKFMDDKAYEYERLAQRHRHYGVEPAMIKAANQAMVLTLRRLGGPQFDHQHLRAWQTTLDYFADLFKDKLADNNSGFAPATLKAG